MTLLANRLIIIYGPTGVGKSSFGLRLAENIKGEIVNADMGQLYVPLAIGTAKPDRAKFHIKHHLFDVINNPIDCTAVMYRDMVQEKIKDIWARKKTPVIVGGSGFYIHSLFFPPSARVSCALENQEISWQRLNQIDPVRAQAIHPNDHYRIERALAIWQATGQLPSQCMRPYVPFAPYHVIYLTRDRNELASIINNRTISMIDNGWLDECKKLVATGWESFVRRKKLIGYGELFDCLSGKLTLEQALPIIQQKTRQYAKRQETFWHTLSGSLHSAMAASSDCAGSITELNLTLHEQPIYINQLSEKLNSI